MKLPLENQDPRQMSEMFERIAPRYDLIKNLFSFGMDRNWKRFGVEKISLPQNAVVLDLASGTGDFAQLVRQRLPRATVVAMDLSEGMLVLARKHGLPDTVCGDGTMLPFAEGSFDCVIIGYGLRNFSQLQKALQEIERVTRPGGSILSLDFFLPANHVLRRIYLSYLYAQGAFWGMLFHGRPRLYTYIPDSLRQFVTIDQFTSILRQSGYDRIETRSHICGGIGLHWATKNAAAAAGEAIQNQHSHDLIYKKP